MEKDISCKCKGKKAGVAVLISGKIDFKTKAIVRKEDKEKGKKEENSLTIKWHCIHIYQ